MTPFIVCTTPRTRTAWLATWLTYGKCFCTHEVLQFCSSFAEMKELLESIGGIVGNSDSANTLFIDSIVKLMPEAKIILVTRPTDEWVKSAGEIDIPVTQEMIDVTEQGVERVRSYNPLELTLKDLDSYATLASLWENITGNPDVEVRTRQMMSINIQPHLPLAMPMWKKNAKNFKSLMQEHLTILENSVGAGNELVNLDTRLDRS